MGFLCDNQFIISIQKWYARDSRKKGKFKIKFNYTARNEDSNHWMNAGCQQFFCENYYLTKTKFWCFKVTSICCFWTKLISHLKSYTSIINRAPSENDVKVKLLKQPMKNIQNQAYICQLCKICLNLKKTKNKKKTHKQTNKKEISNRYLREHQQKTCFMLSRFLAIKGGEAF